MTRIVMRAYLGKLRQWERSVNLSDKQAERLLPELAEQHATEMAAGTIDMIEVEFLDEPDVNQRFFRFGTNPAGMVIPIGIKL